MTERQVLLAEMSAVILAGRHQGAAQAVTDAEMILAAIDAKAYDAVSHGGDYNAEIVPKCDPRYEHADGEDSFLGFAS